MAQFSKIEWTEHTHNHWLGCTKVSPACHHCYAEAWAIVAGLSSGGQRESLTTLSNRQKPLKWNAQHVPWKDGKGVWHPGFYEVHKRRQRVFCSSLADVYEDRAELAPWRDDLFDLIIRTPHLDWLLLTKRPENIIRLTPTKAIGLNNVWIGTTVENQHYANLRVAHILKAKERMCWRVAFLSMEPLLGPVQLTHLDFDGYGSQDFCQVNALTGRHTDMGRPCREVQKLDWIIAGGESGHHARPMHPQWVRSIRDECATSGTPFLFKQWGKFAPVSSVGDDPDSEKHPSVFALPDGSVTDTDWNGGPGQHLRGGQPMLAMPKIAAGRLLDGIEHNGFPQVLL